MSKNKVETLNAERNNNMGTFAEIEKKKEEEIPDIIFEDEE